MVLLLNYYKILFVYDSKKFVRGFAIITNIIIIRCVTKIKNCSGFMRVHRILKVWSLLTSDHKNNYFTKIGGTKKIHGSNSRDTSRKQRPSSKNFFKASIYSVVVREATPSKNYGGEYIKW